MIPVRFTYPFCYTPIPEIRDEAHRLIESIDNDSELKDLFSEGKMMGILMAEDNAGNIVFLHAFSGNVKGKNTVRGFVPPIFDLLKPDGHFKKKEAEITAVNSEIRKLTNEKTPGFESIVKGLREKRREMSVSLQEWIFDQFVVNNFRGESMTIAEVFARKGMVPPGGTGECAAPRLLQHACLNKMKPLAMGEFWYGASPKLEVRKQGCFYPSCTGKCGPLLEFMLEGIDVDDDPMMQDCHGQIKILYSDQDIIVLDKPSGMLSVQGRTSRISVPQFLATEFGTVFPCHRLDMDTSGLMVYARNKESQSSLEKQFASRSVEKTYCATLLGDGKKLKCLESGMIDLPLGQDWYDRPRQMVDFDRGKKAVTEYTVLQTLDNGDFIVKFKPSTGRTHQLRVHSAHISGLGHPIKGDRLYGGSSFNGEELQLKADSLSFDHPTTGNRMTFKI